jgi:ppGpp synthetase/RelA/SpoT-type nucleotidyltranferase
METAGSKSALPISYEEFSGWFDDHTARFLRPALNAARKALNEYLDDELPEQQRVRVVVGQGRTKTKARTWKKLNDKYADQVEEFEQIPYVVDDLVGLRIVCTNHSDVDRVVDIIEGMPEFVDGGPPVLAAFPDTVKDWRKTEKPSGYRAYHVNLCTSVSQATEWHVVTCELQVRTLLQESWGELTHEETYKPGARVPPLVNTLSRRMADLMATIDDIAEDLRSELDRLTEDSLLEGESAETPGTSVAEREAAADFLRERVGALSRPTTLAALAWELQRQFGREITDGWFGCGNFKNLLKETVPDARISTAPPSYLLPAGFDAVAQPERQAGFPRVITLLNEIDRTFPLIDSAQWPGLFEFVATATAELEWEGVVDGRVANEVSRFARDLALDNQVRLGRKHIQHVVRTLAIAHELTSGMSSEAVFDKFLELTLPRAQTLGLPQEDLGKLKAWLAGKG